MIRNLAINLAILKSLASETDDEVLLIAATTASNIIPEANHYPQEPLPPVILPQFLSNFISVFGEAAIISILDWLQEDLLTKQGNNSEVTYLLIYFFFIQIVLLAIYFCSVNNRLFLEYLYQRNRQLQTVL